MTYIKNKKHFKKFKIGGYEIEVQDYGYKSRPPVGIRISGTRLGESTNMFGEPCYFFKAAEAMSMDSGIEMAKNIVKSREG